MSGKRELDAATRHRYRRHLVEAEGVSGQEADAFLSVLVRGLAEGADEALALETELLARLAAAEGFRAAAAATGKRIEAEARTDASVAALVHLSGAASTRATPARVRSLQDYAGRNMPGAGGEG